MQLDEVDYRILLSLQRNGRMPLKDLAKEAHVSVPTARSRIRRLQEFGVIKQFTAVIDQSKLMRGVTAYINLRGRLQNLEEVAKSLKDMVEVVEAYFTTGEHDITINNKGFCTRSTFFGEICS